MCCEEGAETECKPCKDGVLTAAQVLSIVAFVLGVSSYLGIILGLVAMILVLCSCCCTLNKCGFITAGVFQCIAAVGGYVGGVVCLGSLEDDDYYNDDDPIALSCTEGAAVAVFLGASLYLAAAICVFIFACSSRFEKVRNESMTKAPQADTSVPVETKTTVISPAATVISPAQTVQATPVVVGTTTTTMMPDGSKQVQTTAADGSVTTETTFGNENV